ncbi:MAG: DEAD/DEAH box helicase, partial [Betaproteobacteria bacterium]|nr:DEAD/DEAH box helicase [Betaproteobacteria bacterium]
LDEADRMLDMGFLPDIKRILALLPRRRQNLLFSATFSEDIRRLAGELLNGPVMIEVARRYAPAELVSHQVYHVGAARKRALLAHLIRSRDLKQVLVFVRMKRDANRLAHQLERDGIVTTAIHSDKTQPERIKALEGFKQGAVRVLVATDVASRGLDIEHLPCVINFELPFNPEDYVHRIGRTGRAGMSGEAISLVSPDEYKLLADIEQLVKRPLPKAEAPGFEHGARAAVSEHHGKPREHRGRGGAARAERPVQTARGRERRGGAPTPPRAMPEFDFTKPYEPAVSAGAPHPEPVLPHRRKPQRQTAALLGGLVKHDTSKK